MKKISFYIFCIFTANSYWLNAQERLPDASFDNIQEVFWESPLTIKPLTNLSDGEVIQGYLLAWDSMSETWADTLSMIEHSMVGGQGLQKKYTEIYYSKPSGGGALKKRHQITVYNPADWDGDPQRLPDSVLFDHWNSTSGQWGRLKKIEYEKIINDEIYNRMTTLLDHARPDTLENITYDAFWDDMIKYRSVLDPNTGSYIGLDSTIYVFFNGRCISFVVREIQADTIKFARRDIFDYGNIPIPAYTITTQYWSDSLGTFLTEKRFSHFDFQDEYRIFEEFNTLEDFEFRTYRRKYLQYSPDGLPVQFDDELYPGLGSFPDTVYRKDFLYDSISGLLKFITISQKIYPGDWENYRQWVFTAPESVGIPNKKQPIVRNVHRKTLARGVFQLELPQSLVPGHIIIFDASGQILQAQKSQSALLDVDLSGKPSGLYYLHIRSSFGTLSIPLPVI